MGLYDSLAVFGVFGVKYGIINAVSMVAALIEQLF